MFKGLNKGYTFTAILAMGISFSNVALADYSNQSNSGYSQNSYGNRGTSENNQSDEELTKKIQDKIGPGWFSRGYEGVNVQVNNGNVTLTGSVKSWDEKEKLDKEVRDMDGVRNLNSQVTIQEDNSHDNRENRGYLSDSKGYSSDNKGYYSKDRDNKFPQDTYASPMDEQLNKKIRDKVSRGWLWNSYKDVTLNTNNGIVTLEGSVGSPSDQEKLIGEIQKVDGVKSVRSNLHFSNR